MSEDDLPARLEAAADDHDDLTPLLTEAADALRDRDDRIGELRGELEETNEGMVALTLELQEAERRYRSLFEHAAEGIYKTTPDGSRYVMANESMAEILGYDRPEDLQRSVSVSDVFVDADRYDEYRDLLQEEGTLEGFEYRVRREDGEVRWVSDHVRILEGEDGREGYRGGVIDITKRKEYQRRIEDQRDNLEVLNKIVRHDIRNDLQLVGGHARMLQEEVGGAATEHVAQVIESTNEAIEITEVARDVTEVMLQPGTDFTPVDLREVLEDEIDEVRSSYDRATVTVDGGLPDVTVLADDVLESVFRNLLKNAVVHNDTETPSVTVSALAREERVVVRVADDGPGVPDGRKEEIFEEGEQGLDSEGTGLGLYLVRTLVDRYGGDVWIEDNEPKGAVFAVELPRGP